MKKRMNTGSSYWFWLGWSIVAFGVVVFLMVHAIPEKFDLESILFLVAYFFILVFALRIYIIARSSRLQARSVAESSVILENNIAKIKARSITVRDMSDKALDGIDSSEVRELVEELCAIHENGGKIEGMDVRTMIDDKFGSDADKAWHYLGLFVLLGLLGTVIGLNGSVFQMSGILESDTAAVGAFSPVFSQMKGAFGTTLAGIAVTIFFGKLLHAVRGRQHKALERLEFVLRSRLLPRYRPADDKSLLLEIKEGFLSAIEGFDGLTREYRAQAQNQREVQLRFSQSAATFRRTMDDFKTRTDSTADAFNDFTRVVTFMNNTVTEMARSTGDFQTLVRDQFSSQTTDMAKMVESNTALVEQMKASRENEQQLHAAVSTLSSRIEKVFDEMAVTIGERLGGLSDSIVAMQDSFKESLNENMKGLAGELTAQLGTVATRVDESLSGVAGSVRDGFEVVAKNVSEQFAGLGDKFDGIEGTLKDSTTSVIQEFQGRLKEITDGMVSEIQTVSKAVHDGQEVFIGAVGSFEDKMTGWADVAKLESDKVKSFVEVFSKWHKDVAQALEDFKIVLGTRDWVDHIENVKKAHR